MRELLKTETIIFGCGVRENRKSKKVLTLNGEKNGGIFT